jgi:hypothetical protein
MVSRRTLLTLLFFAEKMSSQLNTFVPVLDGSNYQQWAAAMQSYLMAQGLWRVTKAGVSPPEIGMSTEVIQQTVKGKETDVEITKVTNEDEIIKWSEQSEKSLGSIRLRLAENIRLQFDEITIPANLWAKLLETFGKPGMSRAFAEFKGAMDTVIPNGSDPGPAIAKIQAHFSQLEHLKWKIPAHVKGLMMLAKAPSSMESTVQFMCHNLESGDIDNEDVTPEKVALTLRNAWETSRREGRGKGNQQQANKLSAVKPAGNQPPNFQQQQQQQQRGDGNQGRGGRGGKNRRGKRGSGKNAQQQLQQNTVEPTPVQILLKQLAEATEQAAQPQPGPSHQWVPDSSFATGPSNQGYNTFASSLQAGKPLASTITNPYLGPNSSLFMPKREKKPLPAIQSGPHQGYYPSFNAAVNLAHSLDVPATAQTLKTLEIPEKTNKRPRKRARKELPPRGEVQGDSAEYKGKGKARDDDVVSLDFTDDGFAALEEENAEAEFDEPGLCLETPEYNIDSEMADLAGLQESFEQVPSTHCDDKRTNEPSQVNCRIALPLFK